MNPEEKKQVEKQELTEEVKSSYLDYAMSVIVGRALPDVRDGLKPVQRRILWAMWETGLKSGAKLRKSAAVVGEVMKSYHPHGDMSIYDTMVRLAQDFSLRYPLITGQGNWGSVDGDNAAAMRYTECRLSKISEELLLDIEKETVDWQPNYDGSTQEPKVFPAKLPNLLINGSIGIAVGMATNIPPHNLTEVIDATAHLIAHPDAAAEDLAKFIQGPDFPTGGIMYDRKAINQAYAVGRGAITVRAKTEITERKNDQFDIVITEIPYQVNKSELIIKIAELVTDKRIEGIKDVRDESGREGMRIVIEVKNGVPPQKILNQLFKFTDLQKDFHLNMLALADGIQPQVLSLKDILEGYLGHRKIVIRRRTEFDLKKAKEREHILEGLALALGVIDKIIATIKKSANREEAHKNLMKQFRLTEIQSNAILDMRLSALAALERQKIEEELAEKKKLIKELELILKSAARVLKLIEGELADLKAKYGDERRTKLVVHGLTEFKEEDLVPQEEAMIALSHSGYIKRMPPGTFKVQHRGGKGLIGGEVADEDFITHFKNARTHDNVLFFTDKGRVFQTKAYEIPVGSRTSKGKLVHSFLEIPPEEKISALISYPENAEVKKQSLVMATRDGVIKKTPLADFGNVRRTGIIAIKLGTGDLLNWVNLATGADEIMLTTTEGQAIRFKENQVRPMGRTAAGVTAIRLKKNDRVSSMNVIKTATAKTAKLLVVTQHGLGKQTPLGEYKIQRRGGSGIKTVNITAKTGPLIGAHVITDEKELFALSAKGQIIRTEISTVRVAGRVTQGVRIMNLDAGDRLAGVICL